MYTRRGVTLIELLVSLAILGTLLGLAALQGRSRKGPPDSNEWARAVRHTYHLALRAGRPVTTSLVVSGKRHSLTVTEDGIVIADSELTRVLSASDSSALLAR